MGLRKLKAIRLNSSMQLRAIMIDLLIKIEPPVYSSQQAKLFIIKSSKSCKRLFATSDSPNSKEMRNQILT